MNVTRRHAVVLMGAGLAAGRVFAASQSDDVRRLRALLDASAAADERRAALSIKPRAVAFVDPLGDAYARSLRSDRLGDEAALARIRRDTLPTADRIAYDVFAYQTSLAIAF